MGPPVMLPVWKMEITRGIIGTLIPTALLTSCETLSGPVGE